jgi:hypothetical protein
MNRSLMMASLVVAAALPASALAAEKSVSRSVDEAEDLSVQLQLQFEEEATVTLAAVSGLDAAAEADQDDGRLAFRPAALRLSQLLSDAESTAFEIVNEGQGIKLNGNFGGEDGTGFFGVPFIVRMSDVMGAADSGYDITLSATGEADAGSSFVVNFLDEGDGWEGAWSSLAVKSSDTWALPAGVSDAERQAIIGWLLRKLFHVEITINIDITIVKGDGGP